MRGLITKQQVKELFAYKDGHLYWLVTQNCKAVAGSRAGFYRASSNSIRVVYQQKEYVAARLIFLLRYGWIPKCVFHKDRNPFNNRIENLHAEHPRRKGEKQNQSAATHASMLLLHARSKRLWRAIA